jgi:trehalose-6-phosphate synthase
MGSLSSSARRGETVNWNREFLKNIVTKIIDGHRFIVVSSREPYLHCYSNRGIEYITPASGMASAIMPIMTACGGIWIAHGAGEADRDVVDEQDHVAVPPADPKYTLRRVWLSKEEEEGFYFGYANEGLWPLSHIVYARPIFRERDWEMYRRVNEIFCAAVLQELRGQPGFVFIQDYHFALLSRLIKNQRPDVVVAQFWHVPWPNREAFRVCPQGDEILDGLLGNDILGFHLRYHCLNFLDTVNHNIEAIVDYERFSVTRQSRETLVRAFPISIDFDSIDGIARSQEIEKRSVEIRADFRVRDKLLGVGIDRIDYTKGIIERYIAIDRFLEKYPAYRGKFVFMQLGPISRIHIPKYREYNDAVYHAMLEVNDKWQLKDWQPIIMKKIHLSLEEVVAHYRAADLCIVSSIHDGMNLVAKEFVAARVDLDGVLLLSQFTGASRELSEALLVNPLAVDQFADQIRKGLEMPAAERRERMTGMRSKVERNNVFRWAGHIVEEMKKER